MVILHCVLLIVQLVLSILVSQGYWKGLQVVRSRRCHPGLVHGRCSGKVTMVIIIVTLLKYLVYYLAPRCYVICQLGGSQSHVRDLAK